MPISIDFGSISLSKEEKGELEDGVLGDDVYVQFLCSTDNGYDPNSPPDDRVRPSHAAFHGRIFKLADAPVPPLDYGCRCAVRYVAAPKSAAAKVIPAAASSEPTTAAAATEAWLEENVPELDTLKRSAAAATSRDALSTVTAKAKKLGVADPRMIAQMIIDMLTGAGDV